MRRSALPGTGGNGAGAGYRPAQAYPEGRRGVVALKQNPQVILANLQVSQSEQDRRLARAGLLPQANGNLSETVNRLNLHAAVGLAFPGFPTHVGPFEGL